MIECEWEWIGSWSGSSWWVYDGALIGGCSKGLKKYDSVNILLLNRQVDHFVNVGFYQIIKKSARSLEPFIVNIILKLINYFVDFSVVWIDPNSTC